MVAKTKIKEVKSIGAVAKKLKKASGKAKKIDWNKYFGKIKFSVDAVTYQKKMRDEWSK